MTKRFQSSETSFVFPSSNVFSNHMHNMKQASRVIRGCDPSGDVFFSPLKMCGTSDLLKRASKATLVAPCIRVLAWTELLGVGDHDIKHVEEGSPSASRFEDSYLSKIETLEKYPRVQ